MTDNAPPATPPQVRPFADILNSMSSGAVHRDVSNKLREVVEAVQETHKDGTLTLTIKVLKSKINGAFELDAKVTTRLPEPKRGTSLFFADSDNNLCRDDPRQQQLDFGPRAVPTTGKAVSE